MGGWIVFSELAAAPTTVPLPQYFTHAHSNYYCYYYWFLMPPPPPPPSLLALLLLLLAIGWCGAQLQHQLQQLNALNGSEVVLSCPPADFLVRTHMAPTFEEPQLVRRLDWFQDESLVASFQQDVLTDISQQWWVAGTRYELRRPFYQLRIAPSLPQDSGEYRCRLETDPLFALDITTATVQLTVMVKPPPPSKPKLITSTDTTLTLNWNQSVGQAHMPILRYSILISQLDEEDIRVITTENNSTRAVLNELQPNTQYVLSVRSENVAGESAFGPELLLRTLGTPPRSAPIIESIVNGSEGCVKVEWKLLSSVEEQQAVVGFRLMAHRVGIGAQMREWYVKGERHKSLCGLEHNADYMLSVEADNGYGYSPSATRPFRTDEAPPGGPPEHIVARVINASVVMLTWREPPQPNGHILSYQIYYKEPKAHQRHPTMIRLLIEKSETAKAFAYNVSRLAAHTQYKFRLSASTLKGEGEKSPTVLATTDHQPPGAPSLLNITRRCGDDSIRVEWSAPSASEGQSPYLYRLMVVEAGENDSAALLYNTSNTEMAIANLEPNVRYWVKVGAAIRSLKDNETLLEGPFSKAEMFLFQNKGGGECVLQSSLCPQKNTHPASCNPLSVEMTAERSIPSGSSSTSTSSISMTDSPPFTLFLLLSGLAATLSLTLLFTFYVRRRCVLLKEFMRKAEKGHVNEGGGGDKDARHEIISLVHTYPPPVMLDTMEDISYGQTITVTDFDAYCDSLARNDNHGYALQFKDLEADTRILAGGTGAPPLDGSECGEAEQCIKKDRYVDIGALGHSRIKIVINGAHSPDDGYINANYVDSCDEKNAYIATQAPLPQTFTDFWSMVWQEKCNLIVAVTNLVESGRRKCDQYWPSSPNSPLTFDEFHLALKAENSNCVFVHRIIRLQRLKGGQKAPSSERIIHQLHFTSWPDHGVPQSVFPLLYFLHYLSEIQSTGPLLVHCSAGVGRSGAFILIDSIRRHLLNCDRFNLQAHLRHIRRQRARLVQTLEQYLFCHEIIRQLIRHGITRQPLLNYSKYYSFLLSHHLSDGRSRMELQYEEVCKCPHTTLCERPIGCTVLPGYHSSEQYLVCNWAEECPDLWATCWKYSCCTILLMGSDSEVGGFFRRNGDIDASATDITIITTNGIIAIPHHQVERRFTWQVAPSPSHPDEHEHILLSHQDKELLIRIIRVPASLFELDTWHAIEHLQQQFLQPHSAPVMVLDPSSSGGRSSAPYILCALQSLGCMIEEERYVDVLLFLTQYRQRCCGCWSSQSNIEYIYSKVMELIQLQQRK